MNNILVNNIGLWWQSANRAEPLICVYCGEGTSRNDDKEHIIPEALGNNLTLYRGAVCGKCNRRLGNNVDSKIFREPLMASGQVATGAEGKRGIRKSIGAHVKKENDGVTIVGGTSGKNNEYLMARAIAKCGVNIFTDNFGSVRVRDEFPELVQYVVMPKSSKDVWPWAGAFTPLGGFGVSFGIETFSALAVNYPFFIFFCASGVFGSSPIRQTPEAAETIHDHISSVLAEVKEKHSTELVSMTYVAN